MIVELTGMPCIGKTSLIKELEAHLGSGCVVFEDQLVLRKCHLGFVNGLAGFLLREILIIAYGLLFVCLHPVNSCSIILMSFNIDETAAFKLNVARNTLKKFGRWLFCRLHLSGTPCVVFDEGASHLPFNLYHAGMDDRYVADLYKRLGFMLGKINLVALKSPEVDVVSRLKSRGHKRLRNKSTNQIVEFVDSQKHIFSQVEECANDFFSSVTVIDPMAKAAAGELAGYIEGQMQNA